MGAGVHQAALIELALNLDQGVAQTAQHPDAGWLIVHVSARAPVRRHDPPQDQRSVAGVELGFRQDVIDGVLGWQVEFGRHARLVPAGPDQSGFGPGTEREPQCVQQDGFSGAGLTGQHR